MTTTLHPHSRALLHQRIATKQAQQAQRRAHAADLHRLIEHCDVEILNLQAQLDRGVTACQPPPSDAAAAPVAPSAADTSSKHAINLLCPRIPTKPDEPALCLEEN